MTLPKAVRYHLGVRKTPSKKQTKSFGFGLRGRKSQWTLHDSSDPSTFLFLQVAELAQLVDSCRSTAVWMLEALEGLSGGELADYLGMTG